MAKRLLRFRAYLAVTLGLTLLASVAAVIPPVIVGSIIDAAIGGRDARRLLALCAALAVSWFVSEGVLGYRDYIAARLMFQVTKQLRLDVCRALFRAPFSFFRGSRRAEIGLRVTDDVGAIGNLGVNVFPKLIQELVAAVLAAVVILSVYWPIAVLALGVYALYLIPVRFYGERIAGAFDALREHNGRIAQFLQESLETVKLTKILGAERQERAKLSALQRRWARLS